MPIEEAEKIAQSQVAWAILFILLFFIIIRYLIKTRTSERRRLWICTSNQKPTLTDEKSV